MSFILDALKKSETDRQRQNGPALFEVKVAPPRNGLPLWAVGLAVLLAVNLVIVAWVLLRRPPAAELAVAAPPQTANPAQYYPGTGQASTATPPGGLPGTQPGQVNAPGVGAVPVAGTAPTTPLAQTAGMTQPTPVYPGTAPASGGNPSTAPGSQLPAGENDISAAQADAAGGQANPDDYAPAADPPPPSSFGNHVTRGTSSGVPLYQDAALAAGNHVPQLRLDLHVFAAKPQDRFVMINMHKLHEGDTLPEGVRVESITPEGAVMSSKDGTRFLLPRE